MDEDYQIYCSKCSSCGIEGCCPRKHCAEYDYIRKLEDALLFLHFDAFCDVPETCRLETSAQRQDREALIKEIQKLQEDERIEANE